MAMGIMNGTAPQGGGLQLKGPGAELICRRLHVIREAHRASPGQPDYSAAGHIMGWKSKRSAHAIAKEARKAKEEQSLRRPNIKKPAKGEGAKDQ